jgi:hypothetical protein
MEVDLDTYVKSKEIQFDQSDNIDDFIVDINTDVKVTNFTDVNKRHIAFVYPVTCGRAALDFSSNGDVLFRMISFYKAKSEGQVGICCDIVSTMKPIKDGISEDILSGDFMHTELSKLYNMSSDSPDVSGDNWETYIKNKFSVKCHTSRIISNCFIAGSKSEKISRQETTYYTMKKELYNMYLVVHATGITDNIQTISGVNYIRIE